MTNIDKSFIESIKHGGARSFYKRAVELGIKVVPLKESNQVVRLSYEGKNIFMRKNTIPLKRNMGGLTRDKSITKAILKDVGVSVPRGFVYEKTRISGATLKRHKLKLPLIAKPVGGTRSNGVTWNINTLTELNKAIKFAKGNTNQVVLIEEMFQGEEFRVLILNNKIVAVVHKIPPIITGDGVNNIESLISTYNKNRKVHHLLKIDKELRENILAHGFRLKSILKKGEKLQLKNTFLMSEGARLVSYTKQLDRSHKDACLKAVSALNLQMAGVDILAKSANKKSPYVILEVNPSPYFNMHEEELVEGEPVDVSTLLLKELFPTLKI